MGYMDKWTAIADDVLAVILKEKGAWIRAIDYGVTNEDLPPGPWRDVYAAAVNLIAKADGGLPSDVAVARECGDGVTVEWVAERRSFYDSTNSAGFEQSCKWLVNDYGPGTRALQVVSAGQQALQRTLDQGGNINGPVDQVIDGLAVELSRDHDLPVAAGDVLAEIVFDLTQPPQPGFTAGIEPIDTWFRSVGKGQLIALIAPRKKRKTTISANVVLNAALAGQQINVFSFDEDRKRFTRRLLAMLMSRYLWEHNLWDARTTHGAPLNSIDGPFIRNAGENWISWPLELVHAFEYARDTFQTVSKNFRIYDTMTNKGATFKNLRANCRADSARFGGLDLVMVDHLTRFEDWATTYERAELGSAGLHTMSGELDTVVWLLAQVNASGIGTSSEAWAENVKGGAGLGSNADVLMSCNYRAERVENNPTLVQLMIHLMRDGDAPQLGVVEIAPASGWITPRQYAFYQIDADTWDVVPRDQKQPQPLLID